LMKRVDPNDPLALVGKLRHPEVGGVK
jgi:hypothetical protein